MVEKFLIEKLREKEKKERNKEKREAIVAATGVQRIPLPSEHPLTLRRNRAGSDSENAPNRQQRRAEAKRNAELLEEQQRQQAIADEARQIVDMAVGVVVQQAVAQPQHLFRPDGGFQGGGRDRRQGQRTEQDVQRRGQHDRQRGALHRQHPQRARAEQNLDQEREPDQELELALLQYPDLLPVLLKSKNEWTLQAFFQGCGSLSQWSCQRGKEF